jgi:hypothetical protein
MDINPELKLTRVQESFPERAFEIVGEEFDYVLIVMTA